MIAAVGMMTASVSMGNLILNGGFDDEGTAGESSAAFWGDDSEADGVTHGRSHDAGIARSDEFAGTGRDWVMRLQEPHFEHGPVEVWQQHVVGAGLGGQTLIFSGDFHLSAGGGFPDSPRAELRFLDGDNNWIDGNELNLELWAELGNNRNTWATLSDSVVAPENAEAWRVTFSSGIGPHALAVDNVSVIPEPGTAGMLVLSALGALGVKRLRRLKRGYEA